MGTAGIIALHETRRALRNGLFISTLAVVLLVTAGVLGVATLDQQSRRRHCEQVRSSSREGTLIAPPAPLSLLTLGLSEHLEREYMVDSAQIEGLVTAISRSPARGAVPVYGFAADLTNCIRVFIGLLGLLCGAGLFATERESGTLRMVLSHPVRRGEFFFGKALGGLLVALVPVLLAFTMAVAVLLGCGWVRLSAEMVTRLLLLLLAYILYQVALFFLGVLVSTRARNASDALSAGIVVWILIVFLAPSFASPLTRTVVPARSEAAIRELHIRTWAAAMMAQGARNLPEEDAREALSNASSSDSTAGYETRGSDRQMRFCIRAMNLLSPAGALLTSTASLSATGFEAWRDQRRVVTEHFRGIHDNQQMQRQRVPLPGAFFDPRDALPGLVSLATWAGLLAFGALLAGRWMRV